MDYSPPPQIEHVRYHSVDELRERYRLFISPFNQILAHILEESKYLRIPSETTKMFEKLLATRQELIVFLDLEEYDKDLMYQQTKLKVM